MTEEERRLHAGIEALPIGPADAALTFEGRLARENGWTAAHAAAVVAEYRRFLFLAATDAEPVTPSDAVDQAWHLHLAYTRSYWDDLCGRVLGRPLHHGPTEGGAAERARYRAQYERTLARYGQVFGHPPPPAVWPPADDRFRGRWIRVDGDRVWLFDPSSASRGAAAVFAGGLGAGGVAALVGFGFAEVVLTVIVVTAVAALFLRQARSDRRRRARGGDDGCGFEVGGDDGADGGDGGCGGCGGD